jgi:hypothetical protein
VSRDWEFVDKGSCGKEACIESGIRVHDVESPLDIMLTREKKLVEYVLSMTLIPGSLRYRRFVVGGGFAQISYVASVL